jgi:chromosome segregation ATPase
MTTLQEKYAKMVNDYNATYAGKETSDAATAAKEKIDDYKKLIDAVEDARGDYEDSVDKMQESVDSIDDNVRTIQSLNYQLLTEEFEAKLQLDENEKTRIEYYIDKFSDNVYKLSEAAAMLESSVGNAKDELKEYGDRWDTLKEEYAAGNISDADYASDLQEIYDGIYSKLSDLNKVDS